MIRVKIILQKNDAAKLIFVSGTVNRRQRQEQLCLLMNLKNQETRRFKRHKLENTFVVNQEGICQVLDLSAEGVSFGCTRYRKFSEILTVDIIDKSGIQIWGLPIETIWAEKNNAYPTSSIHVVKMGARFHKDLTNEQISALSQLIPFLKEDTR